MSSSDLETGITQILQKKSPKTKSKKKSKPTATTVAASDPAKNEGDNPHWAYEPPEGAVLLDHTVDAGVFEWDAVRDDDDTEIWLIRVPDAIKAKHLQGLEIDLPLSSRTARIGSLTRKHASYDVWCVGDDDDDDDAEVVGGEELQGLACLLPRKKKGKLYIAPKQVSRHIVVSARPSTATVPEHQPVVYQNPPRASYPKEVLRHRFVPYGARSQQTHQSEDISMDVNDIEMAWDKPASDAAPPSADKPAKTKESKGKKRKGDGDSPKKSKKHRANV